MPCHDYFPLVTLLTPNLNETAAILDREIKTREEIEAAASALSEKGPKAVIVKGGHLLTDSSDDFLYQSQEQEKQHWFSAKRISTKNLHGQGVLFHRPLQLFWRKVMNL